LSGQTLATDPDGADAELAGKRIARRLAHAALAALVMVGVGCWPTSGSSFLPEILNQARPESSEAHATWRKPCRSAQDFGAL